MFPLSTWMNERLLAKIFWTLSEHKNEANSLLSSLGDKKLQVLTKFSLTPPWKNSNWAGAAAWSSASFMLSKSYSSFFALLLFLPVL